MQELLAARNALYQSKVRHKGNKKIEEEIASKVEKVNMEIRMLRKRDRSTFTDGHRRVAEEVTTSYQTARHHLDMAFDTMRQLHRDAISQVEKDDDE